MENRIKNLEHIPYESFDEIKSLVKDGQLSLGARRDLALEIMKTEALENGLADKVSFWVFLPYMASFGFIAYIFIMSAWWLIWLTPLLLAGYLVFHPSIGAMFGKSQQLLILLLFAGLGVGLFYRIEWLWIISLVQIINWQSLKRVYGTSIKDITKKALESEKNFCILWNSNVISIHEKNGTIYFNYFVSYPDGRMQNYEERNNPREELENILEEGDNLEGCRKVFFSGINYNISEKDLNNTYSSLYGYALNEMKLSLVDAVELSLMTLSMHKNSFGERDFLCDELIKRALEWQNDEESSSWYIEDKYSLENIERSSIGRLSVSKLYLMTVIWFFQLQSERREDKSEAIFLVLKNDTKIDFPERVIPTILTWYNSMREHETADEDYCMLLLFYAEYLSNTISSNCESFNFLNYLKKYKQLFTEHDKTKTLAALFSILFENRPSSDLELAYVNLIGEALDVKKERIKEIGNKVMDIDKKRSEAT